MNLSKILAALIESRLLKTQIFTFKALVKLREFVVKHYIDIIYLSIVNLFSDY